ncbi:UrcA family protein [Croceicoccus ponticola]|uniref:UrcA family protein n=1 Tax=Croceicoccus ponticola TaxID=2217664 RepID=A0A437H0Y6_9SPHN|nr:UrcA family protein [Croceicoccus ponticola]RVQ69307.1 UrcA family protein [Croceicoccus ponticola]
MAKFFKYGVVIVAAFPLLCSPSAFAQPADTQEIMVIAPQVTVEKERARGAMMGKVLVYSVQRTVSFADLDLRSDSGVQTLKDRIRDAAKSGCDQISKDYPLVTDDSCMRIAVSNGMSQADQVISRARG